MPIRFRCAYCNQLLGISRRKAGTVVRCPNCAGQVVVPTLSEAGLDTEEPAAGAGADAGAPPLFEGNELDKLLEDAEGDHPSAIGSANAARPTAGPAAPPSPPSAASAPPVMERGTGAPAAHPTISPTAGRPPGIYLSPGRATLLSVLAVVGLAIAFGAGLLVGLFVLAPGH